MSDEAKADALEDFMTRQLNQAVAQTQAPAGAAPTFPTVADLEAQIETRARRRGVGNLFIAQTGNVKRLAAMPAKPTLIDFFKLRFNGTSNHCLQSANRAMKTGMSEEVVLACLLHDVVQELIKVDHGWWGAQLFEPYVPERTTFAIRYHQALRFYADTENGYEYPDLYHRVFGRDYKPEPYIEQTYQTVRKHRWYGDARMVTVNDLYAFDPNAAPVVLDQFTDIIGRHFKQPKEGLGYDNSAVAHMWRSIERPDAPL
jgi:predicted HD phosphohydrolase